MAPITKNKAAMIVLGVLAAGIAVFFAARHRSVTVPVLLPPTEQPAETPPQNTAPVVQPPIVTRPPAVEAPLPEGTDRFIVALGDTSDTLAANLSGGGYVASAEAFVQLLGAKTVVPGGYKISKDMTPQQLAQVLLGKPYMQWVVIPEGLRKEEIADLLAAKLGWTAKQKTAWIAKDTAADPNFVEGVYFPDTYLIPVAETPAETAARLIAKFNEKFAPYLAQFAGQNIKWTTGLTLASIVQREAANDADMPLIAGILWNRLDANMALDVDATLQYARGDTGRGWWASISVADKQLDSPYNTYKYKGLPPHPISDPGLPAIAAVLHPAATDCLYYLHDKDHVTHCAATYEEHQANIDTYLKIQQ